MDQSSSLGLLVEVGFVLVICDSIIVIPSNITKARELPVNIRTNFLKIGLGPISDPQNFLCIGHIKEVDFHQFHIRIIT